MMTTARQVGVRAAAAAAAFIVLMPGSIQSNDGGAAFSSTVNLAVGRILPRTEVHIVTIPGVYGLGSEPSGSLYAVTHSKLIRIDATSMKVLSMLRDQPAPLD